MFYSKKTLLVLLLLLLHLTALAQTKIPLLERSISISLENEPIESALKKIGNAANFSFSYRSSLLSRSETVTASFNNKTVRQILDFIFKGSIQYKERGKHIILLAAEAKSSAKDTKVLSGYIVDEKTGERLKNVSVYDPATLTSSVTDAYGYFQLEIKNPTGDEVKLAINKTQYTDTVFVVPANGTRLLNIPLRFNKEKFETLTDSLGKKFQRFWLATKKATEQAINMENISDTMYRTSQVSVAPFVGTNGKLSGNVINDFSLNIFGGYSLGNRKAEFGGWFNATRGDVKGVQIAGLANGVYGKVDGVQLAGLLNASGGEVSGVQLAGLLNLNFSDTRGVAGAGLVNVALSNSKRFNLAGLGNVIIGEQKLPQLAGLFNVTTKDAGPAQLAGLFNFSGGEMRGFHAAGLFNFSAEHFQGVQLSGLINVAPKTMHGTQIGILNVANRAEGTQIGVLNISNRLKGVPVGVLSIVGKGYHKLEISADEVFYTNVSFRTGVRQFYNIISAGARPQTFEEDKTLWTFGYGIGTAPKLTKWLYLNFDLTANQIVYDKIEKINLLNKLYTGLDFQVAKNLSFTAGVTLNGLVQDRTYDSYPELFSDYVPAIVNEKDFGNDLNLKMWWGAKVGVRFF